MLGLYLAIIAAWLWAVLVFAHVRHARHALVTVWALPTLIVIMTIGHVVYYAAMAVGAMFLELYDRIDRIGQGGAK